jgi:predicted PurR-regulated permease PerM
VNSTRDTSPRWNSTTKLVVAFSIVALVALMLVRFKYLISPLVLAFILSFLLHPLASFLHTKLKLNWRFSVVIIYLLTFALAIGLLTWGGFALIDQLQSLIRFIQQAVNNLPDFLKEIASKPLVIGPYILYFPSTDLTAVVEQLLKVVQPALSQLGSLVTAIASGAINLVGYTLFSILISFFISSETGGSRSKMINFPMGAYTDDFRRIGHELVQIWNAFLRGQLIIVTITLIVYNIWLGGLGVNFFFGLALLAALARFVPWVGPIIAWATYALVAYFQVSNVFGLPPLTFAAIVVITSYIIDVILDQLVAPRLMADALKLHPAAVLIAALVGVNLFGVIGLLLAAPILATFKLIIDYVFKKLNDEDPWLNFETIHPKRINSPIRNWVNTQISKFDNGKKKSG